MQIIYLLNSDGFERSAHILQWRDLHKSLGGTKRCLLMRVVPIPKLGALEVEHVCGFAFGIYAQGTSNFFKAWPILSLRNALVGLIYVCTAKHWSLLSRLFSIPLPFLILAPNIREVSAETRKSAPLRKVKECERRNKKKTKN